MVSTFGSGLLGGIAGGATVAITIKAVDKFSGTFDKASIGMKSLKVGAIAGATAIAGLGASIVALGASSLKVASDFQQTEIAFTTMLGSAEEAKVFLEDLANFARRTPFSLKGVEGAARQLKAVGFETEEILPTLKSVGDVSAGLGLGQEGLTRLILNLGQVRSQTKLTGRELRDFAIAGVPLLDELSKNLGLSTSEIQEMVSKGEIGFEQVSEAFRTMSSEGGRFEDLMGKQAETVGGKFSNLRDVFELMQRELGATLIPVISNLADVFLDEVFPAVEPLIPLIGEFLSKSIETLSKELKPLMPDIIELVKSLLSLGIEVLPILTTALKIVVPILSEMFNIMKGIADLAGKVINVITQSEGFANFTNDIGKAVNFIKAGRNKRVGDFILRPDGSIIETDPRDTIMGFKGDSPGQGMVINITGDNFGIDAEEIALSLHRRLKNKISL